MAASHNGVCITQKMFQKNYLVSRLLVYELDEINEKIIINNIDFLMKATLVSTQSIL